MKKSRFISALTTFAMVGSMIASAIPFAASAASVVDAPSTMEMSLKAEKSSFTMDEVKAGSAKTTVSMYVDKLDDSEKLTLLMAGFKASDDNIKLSNIAYTEEMPGLHNSQRNAKATTAKRRYDTYGLDEANMNFIIQNSPLKYLVLEDANASIISFDVEFPSTMAAGTYTIDFNTAYLSVKSSAPFVDESDPEYGTIITDYTKSIMSNSNGLKPATITLGAGTEPTTEPSKATESSGTIKEKIFDGEIKFWADKVEAKPGETVEVNLYADADLNGDGTVMGLEVRAVYDTAKLSLDSMLEDYGFDASPTINVKEGAYVIATTGDPIPNDPETPFATLTFTVSADAKAGDVYEINFAGCNDHAEPIAQKEQFSDHETYYKPVLEPGTITIVGGTTEATKPSATIKDKIFDGEIKFWADKVEAKPGETVTVNLYADADLNGDGTVMGVEVRAIYDTAKLTLDQMVEDYGFDASPTINVKEGAYVIATTGDPIPNDPETPFATLTFTVSADAKAGDVYEIGFAGCNDHAEPIAQKEQFSDHETYYKPVLEPGSITIVGDETEETKATTAATTVATTKATTVATTATTKATTAGSTKTPETGIVTVTQIVTVPVTVTQIVTVPVTVTQVVTVPVTVTEVQKVTTIEKVTEISYIASEVEKVTVTEISYVPVTSVSVVTEISYVASEVEKVTVTEISYVPVESEVVVTVTSLVTVTSIVNVPGTTATTAADGDIDIDISNIDVEKENSQWYHSDNVEFFKNGIVVKIGDVDVTDDATIKFADTPADVYDGKNFNYTVEFTVEYDGKTATGTIPVKIGPRGDANMSGGEAADLYDAITVAKFILPTKPIDIPKSSFQEFLGDNNEDGVVDLYDAINVAKLILPTVGGDWTKVSKDYNTWIKD